MNRTTKKVLSLVLMMIMIISSVPMMSFAGILCDTIGHDYDWVVVKEATCTQTGTKTQKCSRSGCDATGNTETINLIPHSEVSIPAKAPTCDVDGNTEGKACSMCGLAIVPCETLEATGHKAVEFAKIPATCTTNGKTAGTKCSVIGCNKILSGGEDIEAPGHDYKLSSYTAGSCLTGSKEVSVYACKVCSDEKVTEVAAEHNYSMWKETTPATCKDAGKMTQTCRSCGKVNEKIIDKLAHTEVAVAAKEPTCTEPGNTAGKKCSVCGETIEGNKPLVATGHREVVIKGTPAACGVKGTTDASYCSVCNTVMKDQKELAALEHIMITDTANSKTPNCTTEGVEAKKCSREGCTYTEKKTLPAKHTFSSYTEIAATCTKDGKKTGHCSVCKKTTTEVIPATGHTVKNNASWKTTTEATCTKDGVKKATCSVCSGTATKTIPATGHNIVTYKEEQAPTCEKEGSTASKWCSVCKTVTVQSEPIPKAEHTLGEWTVTSTATCAAAGIKKAECSACKKVVTEQIERLKHTEVEIPAVPATCTTDGSTAGIKCSVCSAEIQAVETIKSSGHAYVKDETVSFDATCDTDGHYKGVCSACGDVKEEPVKATGHVEEVTPGYAADCTREGLSDGSKCTVCGVVLAEETTIPALGHDLALDPSKSTAATCTEKGKNFMACTRCGYTEEQDAEPIEHTWGEWIEVQAPTCDAQGINRRTCATCGTAEDETIESLGGHELVTTPGYDATCTEPGKTNGTECQKCKTIFAEQEDIAPLGHDIEGVEPELIKATTDRDGSYGIYCKVCNQVAEETIKIAKIDATTIKLSTAKCAYNGKKRTPTVSVKDVNGVDLVEDVDFEVEYPAGRKAVGTYNIKVKFIGNYEGEKDLTFTITAGKTSKLSATSSKKDYVKLSWNKVEGATGYRVYIYKNADSKTRKKIASVTGTTYNLTKDYSGKALKIGSEYKIAVVAYTKLEDGTVIHAVAGVPKTFTRTAGKAEISSVTSTTKGKATIKWSDVEGETAYQVWYSTSKDGEYKKLGTGIKGTTYTTKTFTSGKTIYFKVRAYTKVEGETVYGSFGAVKSVKIK
jgi:hypothetical protein